MTSAEPLYELVPYGPFSLLTGSRHPCLFEASIPHGPGIYLFTVEIDGRHLVHYVGETGREFAVRLKEHLLAYCGGQYAIMQPDCLARGELSVVWEGMYPWHRNSERRARMFLEQSHVIMPVLRHQIDLVGIWLFPLQTDARTRKLIEATIAAHLRKQPAPVGTFIEAGVRYESRDPCEPSVRFRVSSAEMFHGIPDMLAT